MNTRRDFLKLGALFVPAAIVGPRVAYSFLRASVELPQAMFNGIPLPDGCGVKPLRARAYRNFTVYIDGVKMCTLAGQTEILW